MTCRLALSFALVAFLAAAAGCSGSSRLDSADAGRTLAYQPGEPDFDLEAVATWRDGAPGVDVYLGIPQASLVFVRRGMGYEARYERAIRLLDRDSRSLVSEILHVDTLRVADYEATQSYLPLVVRERMETGVGEYVVEVALTDAESDRQAVRRQAVELIGPGEGQPHLSRMRVEALRGDAGFVPVVSLHVPAGLDSLRTLVELFHLRPDAAVEVAMHLLRFRSDTTVASPPYWLAPSHGSLAYRGVDYGRVDTLQVSRRRLEDVDREAVVEFDLPDLAPGIYRIETEARVPGSEGADVLLQQKRDLSVKPTSFPHVELLGELVDALVYIAFEDEIAVIEAADNPLEMKHRFDAFWGSLVPNRQVAANLIKLYYERVEEANLFFTSYKEGWKTDRGMVYIILGPPYYVENHLDGEIWYYSYGDRDPAYTYVFDRVPTYERDAVFENYILQRRPYYQHIWNQAVDLWREGQVL